MTKKQLLMRISAILLISIALLLLILVDPYKNINNDLIGLLDEGEHNYVPLSSKELLDFNFKESFVLYLGKVDKDYSDILNALYEASKKNNKNKIYYYDIEPEKRILAYENNNIIVTKDGTLLYDKLLEKIGSFSEIYTLYNEYNEPINGGYQTINTPMVLFIKNGKILFAYYVENLKLSTEEISELENIYIEGFKKIS